MVIIIPKILNITIITLLLFIIPNSKSTPDYTALVYKGCAKQTITDPTVSSSYTQSLTTLTTTLIQHSSTSKFYKLTTGSGGSQFTTISGLYQCRGDLTNTDCYNCVTKIPLIMNNVCPGKVVSARVQLLGCYMLYEVSGFAQISGMQMLFKVCSPTNVAGSGFEMRRDTALQVMVNGIGSNGFFSTSYQGVYVLGQCEGDLGNGDCGLCVKAAVEKAQVECGSSLSGQLYLHKCFISYGYFPNGVPTSGSGYSSSSGSGQNTGKIVAIILGGSAGLGFIVILALFLRGLTKKDDDF